MPNEDTDKLVGKAKEVLAKARSKFPSPKAVPNAPAEKPVATALPNPKPSSKLPSPALGDELRVKAENVQAYDKAIPKMHDGGVVKKDGPVILKKGETVRTAEQEKKMKDDMKKPPKKAAELMGGEKKADKKEDKSDKKDAKDKKKGGKHKHTHIEHLDDGSHIVRHTPRGGGEEVNYSSPDMAGLHAGLDSNLGGGEEEAPVGASPMAGGALPVKA